jgi:hypothetical protein
MYRDSLPSLDSVAKVFDVNHRGAKSIIYAMLERKLVAETSAPWSRQSVVYEVTGLGLRFAAAGLLKPILRQRADHLVRDLRARVEQVSARDELTYFVDEVRAFGATSQTHRRLEISISRFPLFQKPPPRTAEKGYISANR